MVKTKRKTVKRVKREANAFKLGGIEISILNQDTPYVPTFTSPITLTKDFERAIAISVVRDLPALLIGETGTGKTSAAREMAYKRKQGYTRINMNGYTTPDELIGSKSVKNGATYYEDGILTKAMKEGHIVVLDEINATPPDCSFILHGLLDDDKRVSLPNGDIVYPHEDFRIFATMNPDYEGTRSMNRAFLDRFAIILNFEIPTPAKEKAILMEKGGVAEDVADKMVTIAHMARKAYEEAKTMTFMSTRGLLQWCDLVINGGMDMQPAYISAVVNKARKEEQIAFKDFYHAVFKDKPEEEKDAMILTSKKQIDGYEKQIRQFNEELQNMNREVTKANVERDKLKKDAEGWEKTANKALDTARSLKETLEKIGAMPTQNKAVSTTAKTVGTAEAEVSKEKEVEVPF